MPRGQPTMSFGVPPLTRGVKWLGGITVAVSILVAVLGQSGAELARTVVFVPDAFWHGRLWQPFTGVRFQFYAGNWSSLEGLIAAFAVLMPSAQIFLYFLPVQARWMLPISAGITVLFMVMTKPWFAYLPQLFGLGAGVLLAGGVAPRNVLLRAKFWWIDRRLRRSRLRVVRGNDDKRGPFGGSGSDKYLH
jgi:hypothetical protein